MQPTFSADWFVCHHHTGTHFFSPYYSIFLPSSSLLSNVALHLLLLSPTVIFLLSFHNPFLTADSWEYCVDNVYLCVLGLWTTSMTTHLIGPCWNRKQPSRGPHPGARASRHKPPQASKLTNPSLTWKVSSKQPSDVFYRHQLLIYSFSIVFRTIR